MSKTEIVTHETTSRQIENQITRDQRSLWIIGNKCMLLRFPSRWASSVTAFRLGLDAYGA